MTESIAYSRTQIVLHWVVALLIVALYLPVSRSAVLLPESHGPLSLPLTLHVWGGLLILPLMAWRFWLRQRRGVPQPESLEPTFLRGVGRLAHLSLYVILFALPISGIAFWFAGQPWGRTAHEVLRVLLLALAGMHTTAALMHHFALRNRVLLRMIYSDCGEEADRKAPTRPGIVPWRRTKCSIER